MFFFFQKINSPSTFFTRIAELAPVYQPQFAHKSPSLKETSNLHKRWEWEQKTCQKQDLPIRGSCSQMAMTQQQLLSSADTTDQILSS